MVCLNLSKNLDYYIIFLTSLAASLTQSVSGLWFFSGEDCLGLSAMLERESELGGRDMGGISRRFSKSWSCQRSDNVLAAEYRLVAVWPDTAIFNI